MSSFRGQSGWLAQVIARLEALEARVGKSIDDGGNTRGDPSTQVGIFQSDASIVTYTPADLTDWGGSDPGNVDDALDVLAAGALGAAAASPVGARVARTTNQSINNNSTTAVQFDTETEDTGTLHDNVTNNTRITVPVTGKYMITGYVQFASNSSGKRVIDIRVNGSTFLASLGKAATAAEGVSDQAIAAAYPLTAGDYVEITCYQNSGGALNVAAASFAVYLIQASTAAMIDIKLVATDLDETETINVNSTSYIASNALTFRLDFSVIPYTHFRIYGRLGSSDGTNAITMQLAEFATPGTPLSSGGDDLAVTAAANANSGWIAIASVPSTDKQLVVAVKGANGTVDLIHRGLSIQFKR